MAARPFSIALALLLADASLAAEPPARAEPAGGAVLQGIHVAAREVVLSLSRPVLFRASAKAEPPAILIALDDTRLSDEAKDESAVSSWVAGVAALPLLEGGTEGVRVVVKLAGRKSFDATWRGSDLVFALKEPPASAPPPPAVAPAATGAKTARKAAATYRVQVGAFPTKAAAAKLKAELDGKVGPIEVREGVAGGKPIYRVLAGPPCERSEARSRLEKLSSLGRSGFLTKE